ncbi:MAG TPA: hypothetical protein VGK97_11225 [Spongiibacteraceae bacterium]|jgi:hypothetical protein
MKHLKRSLLISMMAILTACSGVPAQLGSTAVEAPKNVDFSKGRPITTSACGFQLLLFIPIAINGRMQNANEELIDKAHGDYISDVKVTESWKYAFVGTVYCTELSAMAYPHK